MVKPYVAYDPVDVTIGANLRVLRKQQHLSLEKLGPRLGVTYQQIQKYETGHNRISASTLYRMTEILDCKVNDLFEGLQGTGILNGHAHPSEDDTAAAGALGRIKPHVVKQAMHLLIGALAGSSRQSSAPNILVDAVRR